MVEAWKVLEEEREVCPDLREAVMKDRSLCGVTQGMALKWVEGKNKAHKGQPQQLGYTTVQLSIGSSSCHHFGKRKEKDKKVARSCHKSFMQVYPFLGRGVIIYVSYSRFERSPHFSSTHTHTDLIYFI